VGKEILTQHIDLIVSAVVGKFIDAPPAIDVFLNTPSPRSWTTE
jgi:hypothetical protein